MHVNGHPLKCPHCQGTSFRQKRFLLNTVGMSFLDLDWLNKSADTFSCNTCGRIEWFTDATVSEGGMSEGHDCPRCGHFIQPGQTFCPNCSRAT